MQGLLWNTLKGDETMAKKKPVREPKQSRSIQMKEKILGTALKLFCKKGFYKTTTNEIAQAAGVSIGSLYSYFRDRDAIFFAILDRYHQQFVALHAASINQINTHNLDKREWLYHFVEGLIRIHEKSREFNRELKVLCYSNPKVAAIMEKQDEETRRLIIGYLRLWKEGVSVEDLEAIAIVAFDFISAIVDRIVFGGKSIDRERILRTGVDALFGFL